MPAEFITGAWKPGYAAPTCSATGDVESAFVRPEVVPLWMVSARLPAGSVLTWESGHGDEGLFVVGGELESDGEHAGPYGAVVIESGARAVVRAVVDSEICHFGPDVPESPHDGPFGPPAAVGHGLHFFDPDTVTETTSPRGTRGVIMSQRFTDSRCPTCRIALFTNHADDGYRSLSHSHSQDEIIHVIEGEIRVGSHAVGAGSTVAITADHRYGFVAPGPFRFVNYRRDASYYTGTPGDPPRLE